MLNRIIVKKFKRLKILISIAWLDLFCQAYSQASDKWWAEKKSETWNHFLWFVRDLLET